MKKSTANKYEAGLKEKTPKQLVALYRVTKDEDKKHLIFRELLTRKEVVNIVETLGNGKVE